MGRTTCLTTGVISALDANLKINYSDTTKPHLANFVNQIRDWQRQNSCNLADPATQDR